MKISINKELTTLAQLPKIKHDLREFRGMYTDGDLLRVFCEQTGFCDAYAHEILSATVEAFPGGTDFDNETAFSVHLLTHGWREFCEIDFYCNAQLEVDLRDLMFTPGKKLYHQRVYKEVNT